MIHGVYVLGVMLIVLWLVLGLNHPSVLGIVLLVLLSSSKEEKCIHLTLSRMIEPIQYSYNNQTMMVILELIIIL